MATEGRRATDHRSEIVTAAGAATTLLALAAVFALAHDGTNVMGWYQYGIIPAGALLVGAVAASGYGIGAWFTGLKMTRRLLLSVLGQLVVSYFIAQYEEYRRAVPGGEIGFWSYFDLVTRAFSFANHDGTPGSPFGALGYAMRALEIGGFIAGGWLVPAALQSKPYCDDCRSYRRTKRIALMPGGFANDSGSEGFMALYQAAAATDRSAFDKAIARFGPLKDAHSANKFSSRIAIDAVRCPRCASGFLAATRFEGHGKRIRRFVLPHQPLTGDAMRTLLD
jgi:hypothetical protein